MEDLISRGNEELHRTTTIKNKFPAESMHNETSQAKKMRLTSSMLLRENLEQIVTEINAKRKRDSDILDELKKELEIQVSTAVNKIEESLFGRYNQTNKEVEEKIQEFMTILTRIEKHESKLEDFKRILRVLNEDVYHDVTVAED